MAKKKSTDEPVLSFEALLDETEALVDQLESGELPLEQSLAVYEKGIGHIKQCAALLKRTETAIRQLQEEDDGALAWTPLESDDDDADNADGAT